MTQRVGKRENVLQGALRVQDLQLGEDEKDNLMEIRHSEFKERMWKTLK